MNITHYEFGRIQIDGRYYDSDVIIRSDDVQENWRRKEGHNLAIEDLDGVVESRPEVVIIGSGYYGRMKVPDATRDYLAERGIHVEVEKTRDAVARFNKLQKESARIVAALHLTC